MLHFPCFFLIPLDVTYVLRYNDLVELMFPSIGKETKMLKVTISMPQDAAERFQKMWDEDKNAVIKYFTDAGFPVTDIKPCEIVGRPLLDENNLGK